MKFLLKSHFNTLNSTVCCNYLVTMKMPNEIPDCLFAPCGMNCLVCYVHLKDKKPCGGCYGDNKHKPERCVNCKIKTCANNKSFKYCYECSDFPCKLINNLDKSYRKRYNVSLIENSFFVISGGMSLFQKEEQKRWKCPVCSGIVSLHDMECSACKQKIQ